jgi:acyl-CoA oxidase
VIDYKTQQARLFPLLASAYAFRFVGEWLKWLYTDVTQKLQANDFSTLPEAHACTAGLKSLTTSATALCYYLVILKFISILKTLVVLKCWSL